MAIIAKYLSTTEEVIDRVYGHFSPDFHIEVNTALKKAKKERLDNTVKERREKKEKLLKKAA